MTTHRYIIEAYEDGVWQVFRFTTRASALLAVQLLNAQNTPVKYIGEVRRG